MCKISVSTQLIHMKLLKQKWMKVIVTDLLAQLL